MSLLFEVDYVSKVSEVIRPERFDNFHFRILCLHMQSSPRPISPYSLFSSSYFFFNFLHFFCIELENLFNAINAPDDGGEEKVEETRSLKPVRIPPEKTSDCLLSSCFSWKDGRASPAALLFIYVLKALNELKVLSLYLNASFHHTEFPLPPNNSPPPPFLRSFFNSRLIFQKVSFEGTLISFILSFFFPLFSLIFFCKRLILHILLPLWHGYSTGQTNNILFDTFFFIHERREDSY